MHNNIFWFYEYILNTIANKINLDIFFKKNHYKIIVFLFGPKFNLCCKQNYHCLASLDLNCGSDS